MKHSIHRISYLGGSPLFDVNELITVTGAVPRTIKNIILPNGAEVLIFLNWQKQIVIFDGTNVQIISDNIQTDNNLSAVYLNGINDAGLVDCHAVVDTKRRWYKLFIPMASSSKMTHCIVLNYQNMCLFPFSNQTLHSSVYAENAIGSQYLIGADYTGFAYYLLKGNLDNATAINEHFISSKLGTERTSALKKAVKISFYFEPTANNSLTYYDRFNFDRTWNTRYTLPMYNQNDDFLGVDFILGTSVLGSVKEKVSNSVDIAAVNNLYQYKITSSSSTKVPWRLHKAEFYEEAIGVGKKYENTR
jgi:hypothetical protein